MLSNPLPSNFADCLMPQSRRAIIVLGAHRSGTSVLARITNLLGATGAKRLMPPQPDNPRGFWEPLAVARFNEALVGNGYSWDNPEPIPETWFNPVLRENDIAEAADLLKTEFAPADLIVLKDPRISRLLPIWLPAFKRAGILPLFLIACRNPIEVAASLFARNGIAADQAQRIWLAYTLGAIRGTRTYPRAVVHYDQLLADWRTTLSLAFDQLGLPMDDLFGQERHADTEIASYLCVTERHHLASTDQLLGHSDYSAVVKDIYTMLRAATHASALDHPRFEQAGQQLQLAWNTLFPMGANRKTDLTGPSTTAVTERQDAFSPFKQRDIQMVESKRAPVPPDSKQLAAAKNCLFPPGHFYSPVPDIAEMEKDVARIFSEPARDLPGIDLHAAEQLARIARFKNYYPDIPWTDVRQDGLRYCFNNPAYSYTDAIFLYSMIREVQPKRIIEVGSGHSSCVTLDTNEIFFGGTIGCTFIEPYPKLLTSLIKPQDREQIEIIGSRVQDVPLDRFAVLEEDDILFIDSTHVSKTGSDVNYIIFEILPRLAKGVWIHFHDIFYPFEYPKKWVMEGRAWNECYILRAFLQHNDQFSIELFSHYLVAFHRQDLVDALPLCAGNFGGNIWLRRISL